MQLNITVEIKKISNSAKRFWFIPLLPLLYIQFSGVFVFVLFAALDFLKSWYKKKIGISIPFDFSLIGLLIVSHSLSFQLALGYLIWIPIKKLTLGGMRKVHLIKLPILALVAYLTYLTSGIPLIQTEIFLIALRYLAEIPIRLILLGNVQPRRIYEIPYHMAANGVLMFILLSL